MRRHYISRLPVNTFSFFRGVGMKIEDVKIPEEYGATIDIEKKRFVLPLRNGGSVVGLLPHEDLQLYAYDVRGGGLPDLLSMGLRQPRKGRFLRTIVCCKGMFEMMRGGCSAVMKAGEVTVDFGNDAFPIALDAEHFYGIETVIEVTQEVLDSVLYQLLQKSVSTAVLPAPDSGCDCVYYFEMRPSTKKHIDELLSYCFGDSDPNFVMIQCTKTGYLIGSDMSGKRSSRRRYVSKSQQTIADDVYRTLTEHYDEKITAQQFANKYSVSPTTVKNYFSQFYGYDYKAYQTKVRMEKAAQLLHDTNLTSGEIGQRVGYCSQSKFGVVFKKYHGMTPLEYRRTSKIMKMQDENEQ